MRLADLIPVLLAAAWVFAPGALLAWALGCRNWVVYAGASAPASVGMLTVAASLFALVGVRFSPLSALTAVALAVLAALLIGRLAARRVSALSATAVDDAAQPSDAPARQQVLGLRFVGGLGVVLLVGSAAVAALSWWHGIGPLTTYNQDHDSITHQLVTAYIQRTGRAAPWEVIPVDVLTTGPVHFYPSGLHAVAALTGGVFDDAIVGLNATLIVFCGVAWATGTAALTGAVLREQGVTIGWQLAGAGTTGLAAAGLYRPAFQLIRDNGVMAYAVALVLVPGTVAALLSLRRLRSADTLIAGLASAGAIAVHPSAAVSVGLTFAAVLLGSLFSYRGGGFLHAARPRIFALLGAGVLAGAAASPVLFSALRAGSATTQFPPDTAGIPLSQSLGFVTTLVYGGFLDPSGRINQMALFVLLLLGLVGCLIHRIALGLVLAWAMWVAITVSAFWSPTTGLSAPVAGFFYNSAGRIQNHISTVVPSLAGLALIGIAIALASLTGRHRALAAPAILLLLVTVFTIGPVRGYAYANSDALDDRYYQPQFYRVDAADRAAARWLADHVSAGQQVMNSANDGSTYAYVRYGVPVVNLFTLGAEEEPYTYELLARFNQLDVDSQIRHLVLDLHVQFVYVDAGAPLIGSDYSPGGWFDGPLFSLAPGLQDLGAVPHLSLAYQSGNVAIWRVDQEGLRAVQP